MPAAVLNVHHVVAPLLDEPGGSDVRAEIVEAGVLTHVTQLDDPAAVRADIGFRAELGGFFRLEVVGAQDQVGLLDADGHLVCAPHVGSLERNEGGERRSVLQQNGFLESGARRKLCDALLPHPYLFDLFAKPGHENRRLHALNVTVLVNGRRVHEDDLVAVLKAPEHPVPPEVARFLCAALPLFVIGALGETVAVVEDIAGPQGAAVLQACRLLSRSLPVPHKVVINRDGRAAQVGRADAVIGRQVPCEPVSFVFLAPPAGEAAHAVRQLLVVGQVAGHIAGPDLYDRHALGGCAGR